MKEEAIMNLFFGEKIDILEQIKEKLKQNRWSTPLFDCDRFRRHIEVAYIEMWSIWQRGEKPRAFAVAQEN